MKSLLGEDVPLPANAADDDVAGIFYTGGTTGRSKGVMLTHRNLMSNAIMVVTAFDYRPDFGLHSFRADVPPGRRCIDLAVTMIAGVHVFIPRFDPLRCC